MSIQNDIKRFLDFFSLIFFQIMKPISAMTKFLLAYVDILTDNIKAHKGEAPMEKGIIPTKTTIPFPFDLVG